MSATIGRSVAIGAVRRPRGFTLIELMIVVAVVAILASIALPAYNDSVRKSRRGQAKADLVEYAQMLERYHSVNNTYEDFDLPVNQSPREAGATPRYALGLVTQPNTFVISATAQEDQAKDRCGDLSISNTGAKTASGSASLSECW